MALVVEGRWVVISIQSVLCVCMKEGSSGTMHSRLCEHHAKASSSHPVSPSHQCLLETLPCPACFRSVTTWTAMVACTC
jgi:hypothetical protein